jgi:hypothetical protein
MSRKWAEFVAMLCQRSNLLRAVRGSQVEEFATPELADVR